MSHLKLSLRWTSRKANVLMNSKESTKGASSRRSAVAAGLAPLVVARRCGTCRRTWATIGVPRKRISRLTPEAGGRAHVNVPAVDDVDRAREGAKWAGYRATARPGSLNRIRVRRGRPMALGGGCGPKGDRDRQG